MTTTQARWLAPPRAIEGQDHLAVQGLSAKLYAQLVPGINNVTSRLRYYSFHPWIVLAFDRHAKGEERSLAGFRRFLRRAECLFALIGARHQLLHADDAHAAEHHGAALVGNERLAPAARDALPLRLSTYAAHVGESGEQSLHYFANRDGGFGQYYSGPIINTLRLMARPERGVPSLTEDFGLPVAQAFDAAVDGAAFVRVLEGDVVTAEDLDHLRSFCPCALREPHSERSVLLDLLFDRQGRYGDEGATRAATLQLLLHYATVSPSPSVAEHVESFRNATYAGSLSDGTHWNVPRSLVDARSKWVTFERGELLSVAIQGLFWAVLTAWGARRFEDIEFAVDAIVAPLSRSALGDESDLAFGAFVDRRRATLAPLEAWGTAQHECSFSAAMLEALRERSPAEVTRLAIEVLCALALREHVAEPYRAFGLTASALSEHTIHLRSFAVELERWRTMPVREVLRWVALNWGISWHLRVALRKLQGEKKDTFRVLPTEQGWAVAERVPPASFTSPRLRTSTQMLVDCGALDFVDGSLQCTDLGHELLELRHG